MESQKECQIECQSICQTECQIECQNIYIIYMPHILPDGISEAMSEYRVTVGITRSKVIFVSYVTYVPPFQRLLMFPGKI